MDAYRPIDVARACDVSVSTVYDWSRDFAEFLSEGARVSNVQSCFTPRDLQVVRYVAELRAQNATTAQILDTLQTTSFGEVARFAIPHQATETPNMLGWVLAVVVVVLVAAVAVLFVMG